MQVSSSYRYWEPPTKEYSVLDRLLLSVLQRFDSCRTENDKQSLDLR